MNVTIQPETNHGSTGWMRGRNGDVALTRIEIDCYDTKRVFISGHSTRIGNRPPVEIAVTLAEAQAIADALLAIVAGESV